MVSRGLKRSRLDAGVVSLERNINRRKPFCLRSQNFVRVHCAAKFLTPQERSIQEGVFSFIHIKKEMFSGIMILEQFCNLMH